MQELLHFAGASYIEIWYDSIVSLGGEEGIRWKNGWRGFVFVSYDIGAGAAATNQGVVSG